MPGWAEPWAELVAEEPEAGGARRNPCGAEGGGWPEVTGAEGVSVTGALPGSRERAWHEACHAAPLCLAGMVPKQVRTDWPAANLAGLVTVDWGDGPDRDKAKHVLVAILLGAMTEGYEGWHEWPIDPERLPAGGPP